MAKLHHGRENCNTCGLPFRDNKALIIDNPCTVLHGARGTCKSCINRAKRAANRPVTPLPTIDQLQGKAREDKKNLDSFLSRIRAQGQKDLRRARQRMVIR